MRQGALYRRPEVDGLVAPDGVVELAERSGPVGEHEFLGDRPREQSPPDVKSARHVHRGDDRLVLCLGAKPLAPTIYEYSQLRR